MENRDTALAAIESFGERYEYDVSYLTEMMQASPGAFAVFAAAQQMAQYRETLPLEAHFVARIVTMQVEDCGPCTQLNLRMAVEAGVDRALLAGLLQDPEWLPQALRDVRAHVRAVCARTQPDAECVARIREHYGEAALAELAVVVAGSRMYPAVKRALHKADHCVVATLDF